MSTYLKVTLFFCLILLSIKAVFFSILIKFKFKKCKNKIRHVSQIFYSIPFDLCNVIQSAFFILGNLEEAFFNWIIKLDKLDLVVGFFVDN